MTPSLRRVAWAGLFLFIAWAIFKSYALFRIHFPIRDHAMIPPLQEMQTFCVGRYLIDLPKGSVLFRAESSAGGKAAVNFFSDTPVTYSQFLEKIRIRWEELKELKKDGNEVFEKPSERIEFLQDGVIFTFRHRSDYEDEWPGGDKGLQHFYDTEGYLWRSSVLYRFYGGIVRNETETAMQHMILRQDDELPSRQGFCGGRSFFPGPPQERESVNFAFRLPTNPPIELRINMPSGRPPKQNLALFNSNDFKASMVRDAKLSIGSMGGEEWITTSTESKFENRYNSSMDAHWYYVKETIQAPLPGELGIHVRMEFDVDTETPPPTFGELPPAKAEGEVGKEEFLALWDGILKTLRPRPGAF
ncbi:T6SS immunity protein Tli4 family protein [Azospira sp. I09]|uniref:T6SS immunity protein Tli4 family protein n=1 Tax=Azospira sp. I09 TaxID=1765049 RepID=UPI001260B9DB|nr:T6SS immunity protein Tli4 family protein [Azospira sp. I09]BBN87885.1 hypothetical protein AZSP09_09080 [Azospira sp. I09]